jgi:mannan endo-1,4-beta-mannosidase
VFKKLSIALAGAILVAAGVALALPAANAATNFVSRNGSNFDLNGQPFRYGGANNYYLHYKSQNMVDDVFANAQAMGLKVIRAWTFLLCGGDKPNSPNGGCSTGQTNWMQEWSNAANGGAGGQVFNDSGPGGLVLIDKMIASASAHGIKLILPFTGNWKDFGGMDQYVTWYGLTNHDQFYTDSRIQTDYKNWISHLINRVNTVTGVTYKNDPTIFAWELANEPRCIDANLPTSGTCTSTTLTNWAGSISTYIKSLDPNHMVSVGDEGFHPGVGGSSSQWPYNVTDGVDHAALTALPNIDFGTYHLYPQGWGQSPADTWGTQWINDHNSVGTSTNKPEILEEFGTTDQSTRDATYTAWTNAVKSGGGDGWNVWLLTAKDDSNGCTPYSTCPLYPDYDGYRVTYPSSTATVLSTAASSISTGGGDTTPPSAPGKPTVSAITSTSASATWTASTDNVGVTGYTVSSGSQTWTSTTNSVSLTGLTAGTTYTISVTARDAAGNTSAASSTTSFTTTAASDTTPPSTPGKPTVSAITSTSASATWTASTDNVGVTGYTVSTQNPPPVANQVWNSTTNSVTLTGLVANTTYTIGVTARDAAGNVSATSTTTTFTTPAASGDTTPPSTPGAPIPPPTITGTSLPLTWAASTDNVGVTSYSVVNVQGSTETTMGTSTTNSLTLTGLTPGASYVLGVYAFDAAGNRSARSTTASITMPAATTAPAGTCNVVYKITNSWPGGFQGDVTIKNTGTAAVNGWTLKWTFANGQVISQLWNGTVAQSGSAVTVTNASWNGPIAVGATVNFGFLSSWNNATNAVPTSFTLNGSSCTIG